MNTPSITLSFTDLDTKKRHLETIRTALKTEFFGIDRCIDSIIDSIQTWYLLPQVLTRPPIVGLWGMTGVGKTALVRSLVSHLGFGDRFLEVQMDGFSSSTSSEIKTISGLLARSGIQEKQQGIVLLDEFQRFRTVSDKGEDIKLERYPDVWMLLSDGRFPTDNQRLEQIVEYMDMEEYWEDNRTYDDAVELAKGSDQTDKQYLSKVKYKRRFNLIRHEAASIKHMLRRSESVKEIMGWDKNEVRALIEKHIKTSASDPFDYSKCLVFVSGNLDEAYKMADSVEDCDTSADVFHAYTLKIGVPEIKLALGVRFRPEQIARLGNNHVIYPSLSEAAYMSLIRRTCGDYMKETEKVCGIRFEVAESVYREIYENSVYPTQGTRPVFTSIHKLFGSPLSDAVLWALEIKTTDLSVALDIPASSLLFSSGNRKKRVKVDLDIRSRRKSRSADFNALVAVHEAGHAIVYAVLFKEAPVEVAINVASFKGGYNLYQDTFLCKQELLNRIATGMGGIIAEELVFGPELRSTGCGSDIAKATTMAAQYVRRYAMDGVQGLVASSPDSLCLEDVKRTDPAVETVIKEQREHAQTVLTEHRSLLLSLADELIRNQKMTSAAFVAFVGESIHGLRVSEERDVGVDYAARLSLATLRNA